MSQLIKHLTFRDIALAALAANGLDADQILKEYVGDLSSKTDGINFGPRRTGIFKVEHEGTTFEFKKLGISVNFVLVARLQGEVEWLEVAFLSDH